MQKSKGRMVSRVKSSWNWSDKVALSSAQIVSSGGKIARHTIAAESGIEMEAATKMEVNEAGHSRITRKTWEGIAQDQVIGEKRAFDAQV